MPTNASAEELFTTVENTSGVERTFGFLGPRGMTLAAGEIITVPGDLVATLGAKAGTGVRRHFDAFNRCVSNGNLRINSRPAPVLYDPVDELPKSLAIQSGALGVVDPEFAGAEGSEHFTPV